MTERQPGPPNIDHLFRQRYVEMGLSDEAITEIEAFTKAEAERLKAVRNTEAVVDTIAEWFHTYYEMLSPAYGYETRRDSAVPWADVPENNKLLMLHTVKALLKAGYIEAGPAARTDGPEQ